ncbi:MAG: DNA adenine methylase [Bacilli bacterium]
MRYIGGKSLVISSINEVIQQKCPDITSALDIFAGSGVVSDFFKKSGFRTISNDFLYFSYVIQRSTIGLNKKPSFRQLGIADPITFLNNLNIADTDIDINNCFIYNNYSPVNDCQRMYFQPDNALKIDVIRLQIEIWYKSKRITENEYYYLLGSLISAVPYVANIAGVFEAYLKFWDKRTYNPLVLQEPTVFSNRKRNICTNMDYHKLLNRRCDLLYADPPYNSREYLPNYHILETIARYDYPTIAGVTGIRASCPEEKSLFCKKKSVETAFEDLIRDTRCHHVLISYNTEGLLSTDRLAEICQDYAAHDSFELFQFGYRRYKSKIPNNAAGLQEQLFYFEKG